MKELIGMIAAKFSKAMLIKILVLGIPVFGYAGLLIIKNTLNSNQAKSIEISKENTKQIVEELKNSLKQNTDSVKAYVDKRMDNHESKQIETNKLIRDEIIKLQKNESDKIYLKKLFDLMNENIYEKKNFNYLMDRPNPWKTQSEFNPVQTFATTWDSIQQIQQNQIITNQNLCQSQNQLTIIPTKTQ